MSSGLPLDQLARDISVRLQKSDDYLLGVAAHLAEARERVMGGEAGKITFEKWCRQNIKKKDGAPYSQRRIRQQIVIANAVDPHLALDEARARNREQMRQSRALSEGEETRVSHSTSSLTAPPASVLPAPLPSPVTALPDDIKRDFEAIMLAWDHACLEAKRRAFQLIWDNGSLTWWNEVPSHA